MLSENLKTLRKAKNLSQEELAAQLHVVRQTISKWEQNRSVPDAEMLVKLADFFEVPVSDLLGQPLEEDTNPSQIAKQLGRISEQMAIRNRRARRIWRVVGAILGALLLVWILQMVLAHVAFERYKLEPGTVVTEQNVTEITQPGEP